MLFQVLFVTLALVSSSYTYDIEAEIQSITVEQRLHLPPRTGYRVSETVNDEDDSLHIVICSYKNSKHGLLSCNITAETFGYKNICKDIKLKPTIEMSIHPVNVNRMIIRIPEYTTTSKNSRSGKEIYYIIDLRNCRVKEVARPMNSSSSSTIISPIVYRDFFDIVVEDTSKCLGANTCRETYSYEGEAIGYSKPMLQKLPGNATIIPRAILSPDKGHYVYTIDLESLPVRYYPNRRTPVVPIHLMHMQYVSPLGDVTKLKTEPTEPRLAKLHEVQSSNSHEKFGICWIAQLNNPITLEKLDNPRINCLQFNGTKMEINATYQVSEKVDWLAVHNLVDGGMLVVFGNCKKNTDGYGNCRKFQLLRIYADGRIDEPLIANDLNLDPHYRLNVKIAERDGDKFCIYFSSTTNEDLEKPKSERPIQDVAIKYHVRCIWKRQIL